METVLLRCSRCNAQIKEDLAFRVTGNPYVIRSYHNDCLAKFFGVEPVEINVAGSPRFYATEGANLVESPVGF